MAEKWPFIPDWQERGRGYRLREAEHFIAGVRQFADEFSDDDARALNAYLWNGNTSPERVDRLMRDGALLEDMGRFIASPDHLHAKLWTAYRGHAKAQVEAR